MEGRVTVMEGEEQEMEIGEEDVSEIKERIIGRL